MPTVQVLSREPDKSAELLQSGLNSLANTLLEKKKMKIYEAQIVAQMRNTKSEEDKMQLERYKNFVSDAHKLKELGGGEEALRALGTVYGSDLHPFLDLYAQGLGKLGPSPKSKLQEAQAGALNAFTGNEASDGIAPPPINDMSEGGQAMPAPRRTLAPSAIVGGVNLVNPADTAQVEQIKTTSRNEADISSRMPTSEEQAKLQAGREVVKVLSRLESMEMPKDIFSQAAASIGVPAISGMAGKKVQEYGSQISKLKALVPFARGGKALTGTEAQRVDVLLNPMGKSKKQQMQDLQDFKDEFLFGTSIIQEGVSPVRRDTNIGTKSPARRVGKYIVEEE